MKLLDNIVYLINQYEKKVSMSNYYSSVLFDIAKITYETDRWQIIDDLDYTIYYSIYCTVLQQIKYFEETSGLQLPLFVSQLSMLELSIVLVEIAYSLRKEKDIRAEKRKEIILMVINVRAAMKEENYNEIKIKNAVAWILKILPTVYTMTILEDVIQLNPLWWKTMDIQLRATISLGIRIHDEGL